MLLGGFPLPLRQLCRGPSGFRPGSPGPMFPTLRYVFIFECWGLFPY